LVSAALRFIHIPGSDQPENHYVGIPPQLGGLFRRQPPNKTQEETTGERRPVDRIQLTRAKDKTIGIVKDSLFYLPDLEVMFSAQFVSDLPRDPQLGHRTGGPPHDPLLLILKVSDPWTTVNSWSDFTSIRLTPSAAKGSNHHPKRSPREVN
jgi:hypothetical protein